MHKRSDEKYCLKIIEEIYPLRILPLYLFKIVEEDLIIICKTYNCDGDVLLHQTTGSQYRTPIAKKIWLSIH